MARHFYYCTGLLILLGPSAVAQQLAGRVVDTETGKPVPYASVSVLGTAQGTTSNAEGEFELAVAKLPGRLVASELSHRTDTLTVTGAQPVLVRLQPSAVALPEVQLGSYTAELIKKAYRQLQRAHDQKTYGQAFYRQITQLDGEATEVQEMVWQTKTDNAGLNGMALAQARYAKKKALISFTDFSKFTKNFSIFSPADSATSRRLLSPHVAQNFTLTLVGVTQNGPQQLIEIGFASKSESNATQEKGSITIDEATHQVLRLHLETSGIGSRSNHPLFSFKEPRMVFDCVFQPTLHGSTDVQYIKTSYQVALNRPLKPDVRVQVLSFTSFYGGQRTAPSGIAYTRAVAGQSDLATIKQTTYNPAFWQNNSAVKRTPLEEEIIKSFEQKGAFGTMLAP
ncbi:carboxypeptidase-like regulatory domain-containing protein [Hymenobacter glacieicola]|uniref:Carboxypeptidase-like regulatory domain-containing protein n=1 Tax=Hymenobacter glacieicola TaxID=1562124 RepID=A0ABQ1WW58_9BACT|nr:carboxypeptidase-like regulatory domain-containing protein [Hymenobacter glacieicola]GGG45068.1 hypothetical protein GCM10011378_21660 [Hymenobacter glacieicola]